MNRFARLQIIGPILVLIMSMAAEVWPRALAFYPSSKILWYLNSNLLAPIRWNESTLSYHLNLEHCYSCYLIGALFMVGCAGLLFELALALAIASNLTFLYTALLVYTYASMQHRALIHHDAVIELSSIVQFALLGCTLLSSASSHIAYLDRIRRECQ